jgi:hypothetical protein
MYADTAPTLVACRPNGDGMVDLLRREEERDALVAGGERVVPNEVGAEHSGLCHELGTTPPNPACGACSAAARWICGDRC